MDDPEPNSETLILVVDGNEANRALARETLEDEGYRVLLATTGADAIAAFEEHPPDCVILDVRMPGLDGFGVCEQIRKLGHGADTPVIFLTALRDVDTFDRALRAGGDDFLTKPVRPKELVVRVQTALKLRRMRSELAEHYELLKRQRDDLMRLQLQKERLTTFVVHDLKKPVNSIDLHAQLLLRDRALPDEAGQSVSRIRADARQLTRMIMNLLDVSKADEGKLVPKRTKVDLTALVRDVLEELEINAQARKVRLEALFEVDRVDADEDLLRRTLANVIENAIRHAPASSAVTVRTTRSEGSTEICVRDAGRGIPADLREKVFDPFVQLEESATPAASRSGRGLGLAFCKLVIDAHGGRLWVEDAAPGAAFCVRLPDEW